MAGYGCSSGESRKTSDATSVRLALPKNPVFYLPAYLARELGYFQAEGISVDIQDLPGGAKNIQAMLGGSADLIGAVYEHTLWLAAENRPTRCFALFIDRPGLMLVVSPLAAKTVRTIADLKGKNVGVATPGSQSHFFLNYLLEKGKMSAEDVSAVGIGMGTAAVAAIERGKVDAAAVTGSAIAVLQRRHPGLVILANGFTAEGVQELFGLTSYPTHGLLAPDAWLKANPGTAHKLARAVQKASRWIREQSPEKILEKLPAAYRMEDAAADIDAIRMTIPMLSVDGKIKKESAEAVRRVLSSSIQKIRDSNFDITSTYTNQFVEGA
jgi:NitT/TauT family transport system substrate-binding protein